MRYNHILVTTDFSEHSVSAFEFAAYEAKMNQSKVTLLSVVQDWDVPDFAVAYIPNPELIANYREELRKGAENKLQQIAKEKFHGQDVTCKVLLSGAPVAQEICDYAKENGCNLIMISSHGRGAIGDLIVGSVVQKVLRLAQCPVMVIPALAKK